MLITFSEVIKVDGKDFFTWSKWNFKSKEDAKVIMKLLNKAKVNS